MSSFYSSGVIIDEPYAAGKFTAAGAMTWTVALGDVLNYRYSLFGKMMTLMLWVAATATIGGVVNTSIRVQIPGGYVAKKDQSGFAFNFNNATFQGGAWQTAALFNLIDIFKLDASNYVAGATGTRFNATFEVR
jgi:hypothetical protein